MLRRRSVLVLMGAAGLAPAVPARAWQGYRPYADNLISHLPQGAVFRRDLERYLDRLAVAARVAAGHRPIRPDDLLRNMARAQAVEMMIGNFVGHTSASGYQYHDRFEAFADPQVHGNHGENAARDRQPGGIDEVEGQAPVPAMARQLGPSPQPHEPHLWLRGDRRRGARPSPLCRAGILGALIGRWMHPMQLH